jgi:hypothetical protein
MSTKLDARQIISRDTLDQLANSAGKELDDLLRSINEEVTPPLQLHADTGANRIIKIEDYTVSNPETGRKKSIPPISNILPTGITFPISITFPATSGGSISISGTTFSGGGTPTLTVASGNFIKVGFNLDATGAITLTFGTEGASPTLATAPATVDGTHAIGFVVLQNSAGTIGNVVNGNIYQYVGGGTGGGSGSGNPILETIKNQFVDSPYELVTPNIVQTDGDDLFGTLTGASYDIANKVIRFTANSQVVASINMLDTDEFISRGIDVGEVDLSVFWNKGSSLQAFSIPTGFTYEISRDGGNNYFTMSMERVGTTDAFYGNLRFDTTSTTESTFANLNSISGGTQTDLDLNATTSQQISQSFTVPSGQTWVIKRLDITLTKTGTPAGNVYVSIVSNSGGLPDTALGSVLAQTNAITASSLTTGSNQISVPTTVLAAGTYHVVLSSDAAYKAGFSGSNKLQVKETDASTGEGSYNGTSWSAVSGKALVRSMVGRTLDLRVKITSAGSPTYPCGLDGYGIFYSLQDVGITGEQKKTQQFVFASGSTNSFVITAFNPDPDLLTCYVDNTGQAFKVPTFTLYGNTAVFPANFFDNGGVSTTFTIRFDQNTGGSYDNSDSNARLLASNFLGSTDGSDDRSAVGRGILLRRPDGTLREITIDDSDNIVVYSI